VLIATVVVVVIFVFLVLQIYGKTGIGAKVKFLTVNYSGTSGLAQPTYYVIQDNDTWANIWRQHTKSELSPEPLPEVDFSKKTVIGVVMGTCPTTGYAIGVKEILDTGLSIVVTVEKTYPGKGCGLGQMVTHPCHFVEVDKINKPLIFNTFTRIYECP
jgi:hypothetical protein